MCDDVTNPYYPERVATYDLMGISSVTDVHLYDGALHLGGDQGIVLDLQQAPYGLNSIFQDDNARVPLLEES